MLLESEMETQALLAWGLASSVTVLRAMQDIYSLHQGCNESECSNITSNHLKKKKKKHMLAPVSTCWLTKYSCGKRLTHMIIIITLWKEHQSQKSLPCSTGSIISFPNCLNCNPFLEPEDDPAWCCLCQGSPSRTGLVRVHLLIQQPTALLII